MVESPRQISDEEQLQDESTPIPEESTSRWTLGRVVMLVALGFVSVILIVFIIGLLFALANDVPAADVFQIFRDLAVIALALEGILIIAAIAILIVQVARLANVFKNEVKPILENTQETVQAARLTTEFVGKNAAEPFIRSRSFVSGARAFMREFGNVRWLLRGGRSNGDDAELVAEEAQDDET